MRERPPATIGELRTAISCLPRATRVAMLEGIARNEIVAGAYTHDGGICPMLAAHRAGGRTSFIGFARAWDRFAFRGATGAWGRRRRNARRATERELLILRSHLEASLLEDLEPAKDLRTAIREHQALRARVSVEDEPRSTGKRSGDRDRSAELGTRPGWAWLRIFRRLDEYERALAEVHVRDEAIASRSRDTADPVPARERLGA